MRIFNLDRALQGVPPKITSYDLHDVDHPHPPTVDLLYKSTFWFPYCLAVQNGPSDLVLRILSTPPCPIHRRTSTPYKHHDGTKILRAADPLHFPHPDPPNAGIESF